MPRVVHEDVDPAELFAGGGDDMRARGFLSQIRRRVIRPPTALSNFLRNRGELLFRARRKKDCGAFLCEKVSDSPADSAAGAGNESNLIVKRHKDHEDS